MTSLHRTNQTHPKGRKYDPWDHAHQIGIEVVLAPLRTTQELWLPDRNLLVVHNRLRAVHQRNALAHGVAHAALGHEDDRPKHEKQADKFAARNLIDPEELADLYKWCPDEQRVIAELGVTTRLFRAFVLHHQKAA